MRTWICRALVGLIGVAFAWSTFAYATSDSGAVPVFSGKRAMELVHLQCDLGPRVPGSPANRALQDTILAHAEELGFEARRGCFRATNPLTGEEMDVCNFVVILPGTGAGPSLWLGVHFDSRPLADQDPDPRIRTQPVPGANDGASGVAVLWHLMEMAGASPPARTVVLMFLDGEDSGREGDPESFCLGSAHLAAGWGGFNSLLPAARPEGVIILDMVGDADLEITQESLSLKYAPGWTSRVFERAAALGLPAFQARGGRAVFDDHIPFLRRGLPAVDLIDFDYSPWHTGGDVPSACSAGSLAQSGALLTDLIYNP
ncbi:hypothetical protein CO151_03530 [bacterium CG_4_9_14_3_um_filter_65_15]|nr:MAG: hypothetical protein CO151_03530 [bacterium CG_4_9_14_3_um_filter_65_15]